MIKGFTSCHNSSFEKLINFLVRNADGDGGAKTRHFSNIIIISSHYITLNKTRRHS